MLGRRSLHPQLVDPIFEIERLLHHLHFDLIAENNQGIPHIPMAQQRPNIQMGHQEIPKQMKEYFIPQSYNPSSCIQLPNIPAAHYEIKPSIIQVLPSFYENTNEDPYRHLNKFFEICSTIKI